MSCFVLLVFVFKQKTAYEMRISDWSSDVCSSDLLCRCGGGYHHLSSRSRAPCASHGAGDQGAGQEGGRLAQSLDPCGGARLSDRRYRSGAGEDRKSVV